MAKTRVYELARDLGVNSAKLVEILQKLGADVRNHMSTVDAELERKLREGVAQRLRARRARNGAAAGTAQAASAQRRHSAGPTQAAPEPAAQPPAAPAAQVESARPASAQEPAASPSEEKTQEQKGRRRAEAAEQAPAAAAPAKAPAASRGRAPAEKRRTAARPAARQGGRASADGRAASGPPRGRKTSRKRAAKQARTAVAQRDAAVHAVEPPGPLFIPDTITVKDFADIVGVPSTTMIKHLMEAGVMAGINQTIDHEVATAVAEKMGYEVEREQAETRAMRVEEEASDSLQERPPVVTIMGHVDHGKTTLLDAIRKTQVVKEEAGGITQHIGAYQVDAGGKKVTFLDTPGHEAFTAMRSRGAQVTDIGVLVVAADDGVMPQTIEAINHAKAADVPIIVAINKIDRPAANPDKVKQELAEHDLVPEEWGGDTICVPVAAITGQGLDDLLEMILLVAEMRELRADPSRPARGVVIEAELDRSRGPVATVLVQTGTLRVGDAVAAGGAAGRVRAMFDEWGKAKKEAGPATPVSVLGFSDVPQAGDIVEVYADERLARQAAAKRSEQRDGEFQRAAGRLRLSELYADDQDSETKDLNLVIKADTQGSLEALCGAVEKLDDERVRVSIVHAGVGGITETDVSLASASNGIVLGFQVRPEPTARRAAEREGVEIRLYRVIYDVVDDIKAAMAGLLDPKYEEEVVGRAEVRAIFRVPSVGAVAGCMVTEGVISRQNPVRVLRDHVVVFEGALASLKRFKDDVREVAEGYECGLSLERFNDIKEGDVIEAYTMKEVRQEL